MRQSPTRAIKRVRVFVDSLDKLDQDVSALTGISDLCKFQLGVVRPHVKGVCDGSIHFLSVQIRRVVYDCISKILIRYE